MRLFSRPHSPSSVTFWLICLALSTATVSLPVVTQATNPTQQRNAFLQAERALEEGRIADYRQLKRTLRNYPLLPYLEYKELRDDLGEVSSQQVQHFLDRYSDTPLAGRLRSAWLLHLAARHRWREFLDFFRPSRSTELRCHHLAALLATGRRNQALSQVQPLWLVGRSQPTACDPVFAAWIGAGRLTTELAWKRIGLSIEAGQPRLTRYLRRFVSKRDQDWVDRWLRVRKDPDLILDAGEFAHSHPQREAILIDGLRCLARQQPQQTPEAWQILRRRYRFDKGHQATARHAVALAYLRSAPPEVALEHLAGLTGNDALTLQRKRILLALEQEDWARALSWIDALPPKERNTAQWRYWKGRALQRLGRHQEAQALFTQVAQDRTYYAFLAADRSGHDYYLLDRPVHVEPALLHQVEQEEAAGRARELRVLDRMTDARREWWWLTRHMDKVALRAAARLAANWGWHDQAIFTLARSGFWDDLTLRFPVEHLDLIEKYAAANDLQIPWVLALMRQESAFAEDAHSPAGARGLMQLMPATARQVAKRLGRSRPKGTALFRPETNIPLGTAYLSEIYRRLGHHPVLATAAYNAGPHRVARWLPDHTLDADIWVETIPFRETRTYVQRVMAYAVIYEKRLGRKPGSIVQRMRPIVGTQAHGDDA